MPPREYERIKRPDSSEVFREIETKYSGVTVVIAEDMRWRIRGRKFRVFAAHDLGGLAKPSQPTQRIDIGRQRTPQEFRDPIRFVGQQQEGKTDRKPDQNVCCATIL